MHDIPALTTTPADETLVRIAGRLIGVIELNPSGAMVRPVAPPHPFVPSVAAGIRLLRLLDAVLTSGGDVDRVIAACERLKREEESNHA